MLSSPSLTKSRAFFFSNYVIDIVNISSNTHENQNNIPAIRVFIKSSGCRMREEATPPETPATRCSYFILLKIRTYYGRDGPLSFLLLTTKRPSCRKESLDLAFYNSKDLADTSLTPAWENSTKLVEILV